MCTIYLPKVKKPEKDTNYCSLLVNQQNWFAEYINKKANSTFSQPISKICDVVTFSWKTIHAKLQNLMSSTFLYFFSNAHDFCARKGNKISLSYYWKISISGSEVLICGWNALQSLPRVIPSPPLALIHLIFMSAYHKTLLLQKLCHKTYHWQRGFICKYAWYFNEFQLWLGSLTF